jgi:hypothetical protein
LARKTIGAIAMAAAAQFLFDPGHMFEILLYFASVDGAFHLFTRLFRRIGFGIIVPAAGH